ncbi:alpha/beta hydrolase [bacterium]|nr:alpha/beta hydrolase [bacterium]
MKTAVNLVLAAALLIMAAGCSSTSGYYSMPGKEFTQIDYGYPVKYAEVRNLKIGYIDQGNGDQTLLLIHGLGSNAKGWTRNIPVLAEQYRVIAVDLPGYGYSKKDYYPYSLSWYAQVLTEFLTELGIADAVFVGHSMGGQISIITALEYPDVVSELVLISPAGVEDFTDGEKDWFRTVAVPELTEDATVRTIDVNLKRNFYDTPPEAEFMITDRIQVRGASDFSDYAYAVAQNIKAMVNEPTSDRLKNITQPTLVLFGRNDGLIPNPYLHGGNTADIAALAAEKIPGATVNVFDKTGHFVQFESPDQTNEAILDFLR